MASDATVCGTCGRELPEGDRKRAEWARAAGERDAAWQQRPCEACGATVAVGASACGTCGRSRVYEPPAPVPVATPVRDPAEGDRKRAAWANAAAERDAAWQQRPCEYCGAVASGASACGTCGRSRAYEPPAPVPVATPVRDPAEGERKRAEWARVAAERDAAWQQRPCEYCGAAVASGAEACGTCGRPRASEKLVVAEAARVEAPAREERDDREGDRKRAEWAKAAAERDAAWQCEYCGASLASDAVACGTCGRPRAPTKHPAPVVETPRRPTARGLPVVSAPPTPAAQPRRSPARLFVVAGVVLVIGILGVVVFAIRKPAGETPVESPDIRIAKATSFDQAIAIARPAFANSTGELGESARLLAIYGAAKLKWSDVAAAQTSLAGVEPGSRVCATGEVLQVTRRELGSRKVHAGRLRPKRAETTDATEVAFAAVGTIGTLAPGGTGTFCGVVLGKSGAAVSAFGMFDFEENRRPRVEE